MAGMNNHRGGKAPRKTSASNSVAGVLKMELKVACTA
jgi:hypothetical protein